MYSLGWLLRRRENCYFLNSGRMKRNLISPRFQQIRRVAKYSEDKWLNCQLGMKTCCGQHRPAAFCPEGSHARLREGLMCIMMRSTHQSNTHTHHLYEDCLIKKATLGWWTVYGNSETAFPSWLPADLIVWVIMQNFSSEIIKIKASEMLVAPRISECFGLL